MNTPEVRAFNIRFLIALQMFDPKLRDLSVGHSYHPPLFRTILEECQDDIRQLSIDMTINKWHHFADGSKEYDGSTQSL